VANLSSRVDDRGAAKKRGTGQHASKKSCHTAEELLQNPAGVSVKDVGRTKGEPERVGKEA